MLRVQTSLILLSLNCSLRYGMSAKFPGGGEQSTLWPAAYSKRKPSVIFMLLQSLICAKSLLIFSITYPKHMPGGYRSTFRCLNIFFLGNQSVGIHCCMHRLPCLQSLSHCMRLCHPIDFQVLHTVPDQESRSC